MKKKNKAALGVNGWYLSPSDNICLAKCIFDDFYREEIKEINKHEIIAKIADCIGPEPSNLCIAEQIFETIKFEIANFVIHHEYNCQRGVNADLLLWLDSKVNPANLKKLNHFIDKYLK